MSNWITDREPTAKDAPMNYIIVWEESRQFPFIIDYGDWHKRYPWMPIEEPEPYVAPPSDDLSEIKAKYAKLIEAHEIALEALRYIAKLYADSKPVYQVAYDAYAMKSEAATALERIDEVMP